MYYVAEKCHNVNKIHIAIRLYCNVFFTQKCLIQPIRQSFWLQVTNSHLTKTEQNECVCRQFQHDGLWTGKHEEWM